MEDTMQNPDEPPLQERRPLITFVLGAVVFLAIGTSAWFLFHEPAPKTDLVQESTIKIKMTPPEQQYLASIHVKDISLSSAENFIHQEVIIVNGTVANAGPEAVAGLQLTVRFNDFDGQIALRETRTILGAQSPVLGPGQERSFEISFDRLPRSWNRQPPSILVANLSLSRGK
jgi:hypothetical protein